MADYSNLIPLVLEARELRFREIAGTSIPLTILCEQADGTHVEVVVKLQEPQVARNLPWRRCLIRDLVGSMIARLLGFAVPDYGVVHIGRAFVGATAQSQEGERIRRSEGANFGSLRIERAITDISHLQDSEAWSNILTFDALGMNGDRQRSNPNVLWDGNEIYLIDHGLMAPTWTAPNNGLTPATLFGENNIQRHAAFDVVRRTGSPFEDTREHWKALVTPEFLEWVKPHVPAEWLETSDLDECIAFLAGRAAIADAQSTELRECCR